MNQTQFEDRCSKCMKPTTRVRRVPKSDFDPHEHTWQEIADHYYASPAVFKTACCGAKPLAVPVVKET